MTYSEYKNELIKILKNNILMENGHLESLKKVLNQLNVAYANRNFDFLRSVNKTYSLGIDLKSKDDYKLIISAMEKYISCVQSEMNETELELKSVYKNFSKGISSIVIFMTNLFSNESLIDYSFIARIYVSLIEANVKTGNSGKINTLKSYEDYVASSLEIEKEILKALKDCDYETFEKKSKYYFGLVLNQEKMDKLFDKYVVLERLDELLEIIKKMYFQDRRDIDDQLVDILIENFNSSLAINESIRQKLNTFCNYVYFNYRYIDGVSKKQIIAKMNNEYNFGWTDDVTLAKILEDTNNLIYKLLQDKDSIASLFDCFTHRGLILKSFGLPRIALGTIRNIPDLQYVILTGIKINGEEIKEDLNNSEKKIQDLEIKMASLISGDFKINESNEDLFLELYSKYLDYFMESMIKFLLPTEDNLSELKEKAMDNMTRYIKQRQVRYESSKCFVNPLDDYILNGKVIRVCELEEFKTLLKESNLSEAQKMDYYRQMINLIRLSEEKEKKDIIVKLKEKLLGDDKELLDKAQISGNVEATAVLKEINAIFDLLFDSNLDEDNELILELDSYVEDLKRILRLKKEGIVEDKPSIIYYKELLLDEVNKALKSDYKEIRINLNKIISGNIAQDKEVLGLNLPFKVKYKGRDFKIFYAVLGDFPLIITGIKGDKAFKEIKCVVSSREFLAYIRSLDVKKLIGDKDMTDKIMAIFENRSRGLKK